ncbi:hypothetical protein BIV60_20165 [Bacillus sp. MUM 116]|nr:hypothetical protein BIV60_20165 [Bacillus sp. MUM 116]
MWFNNGRKELHRAVKFAIRKWAFLHSRQVRGEKMYSCGLYIICGLFAVTLIYITVMFSKSMKE